jgi:hypothetical protein
MEKCCSTGQSPQWAVAPTEEEEEEEEEFQMKGSLRKMYLMESYRQLKEKNLIHS